MSEQRSLQCVPGGDIGLFGQTPITCSTSPALRYFLLLFLTSFNFSLSLQLLLLFYSILFSSSSVVCQDHVLLGRVEPEAVSFSSACQGNELPASTHVQDRCVCRMLHQWVLSSGWWWFEMVLVHGQCRLETWLRRRVWHRLCRERNKRSCQPTNNFPSPGREVQLV